MGHGFFLFHVDKTFNNWDERGRCATETNSCWYSRIWRCCWQHWLVNYNYRYFYTLFSFMDSIFLSLLLKEKRKRKDSEVSNKLIIFLFFFFFKLEAHYWIHRQQIWRIFKCRIKSGQITFPGWQSSLLLVLYCTYRALVSSFYK